MAQTNINVRMDETLKAQFDQLCDTLGLSMSAAITLFAKTSVRERRLPISLSLDPFYSEANMSRLLASMAQLEAGRTVAHEPVDELND